MTALDPAHIWLTTARLGVLFFTLFIMWITHRSTLFLREVKPDFNILLSWPETIARLLMVGICLVLAWLSGLSALELGLVSSHPGQDTILGLGLGLATLGLVSLLTTLAIKYLGSQVYSPWLILNILPRRRIEWLLVALAFIPPVVMEELLFRSLWLGLFQPIVPLWMLVIGLSIVFGLVHEPQGPLGMVAAGGINVVFSLAFLWSGSLWLPLLAHFTVNVLQVVVAYAQRDWLEQLMRETH